MSRDWGLGTIRFGGFAQFAMHQFMRVPGVRLVGTAGTHREAADIAAMRFGVED